MALARNDVDLETLKAVDQHIREAPGANPVNITSTLVYKPRYWRPETGRKRP